MAHQNLLHTFREIREPANPNGTPHEKIMVNRSLMLLRWRARNVTRAHSRDHAHYKSVHYFLIRLKNQVSDLAGLFFADSSSTSCSRGLRRQIATNERHIGVSPLQLYKNGNFNLVITLLTLFLLNFAVYFRKLHVAPSRLVLALL